MADPHADLDKHVRAYVAVFVALAVFTVLTVAASTRDFGGSVNVFIALMIAAVKASLVAAIFMHLRWERAPSIWWLLLSCALFLGVLLALPTLTMQDLPPQVKLGSWGS